MIDLTPLDVRNKRGDFKRIMRGYDPQEVDIFLELAAERLEALVRENIQLKERTQTLQQQVSSQLGREQAVQDALVTAQELRADIKAQSQREADHVLKEAETEARRMIAEAEAQVRGKLRGVERRIDGAGDVLLDLEHRRTRFLKEYRQLLERELDNVEVEEGRPPLEVRTHEMGMARGKAASASASMRGVSDRAARAGGGDDRGDAAGDPAADEADDEPAQPAEAASDARADDGVEAVAEDGSTEASAAAATPDDEAPEPEEDVAEPKAVDTGTEAVDVEAEAADAESDAVGTEPEAVDAGSESVDAGPEAVDAGSEAVDAGPEAVDDDTRAASAEAARERETADAGRVPGPEGGADDDAEGEAHVPTTAAARLFSKDRVPTELETPSFAIGEERALPAFDDPDDPESSSAVNELSASVEAEAVAEARSQVVEVRGQDGDGLADVPRLEEVLAEAGAELMDGPPEPVSPAPPAGDEIAPPRIRNQADEALLLYLDSEDPEA